MKRFNIVAGSKFETLSNEDLQSVKGGLFCIACKKRARAIYIEIVPLEPPPGTEAWRRKQIESIK